MDEDEDANDNAEDNLMENENENNGGGDGASGELIYEYDIYDDDVLVPSYNDDV